MAFLTWHERYRLGHAEIDAQHRMLFEFVNHFDDVIQMGLSAEPDRIMEDLITCASGHFKFEEELMEQIGFPGLFDHKQVHRELIQQVREMRARMKAGGHVSLKSLSRFLADWLTNHIMREDLAYKPYLQR